MDGNTPRDIDRMNLLPFNRKARTFLEERGEAVDPACLHEVQLALWALDRGLAEVEAAVRETLEAMPSWNPERLMNFFARPAEAPVCEPDGWEGAACAEELALLALDDIEARMMVHFPWYFDLSG